MVVMPARVGCWERERGGRPLVRVGLLGRSVVVGVGWPVFS